MFRDLETERLILRTWRIADVPELAEGLNNPDVAKRFGTKYPYFPEDARKYIEDAIHNKKIKYAICLKETGKVIGGCGLHQKGEVHFASIWLAKEYHNQGLGTEAASAWAEYCFTVHHVESLDNNVFKGNIASCRMQEKIGGHIIPSVDRNDEEKSVKVIITKDSFKSWK